MTVKIQNASIKESQNKFLVFSMMGIVSCANTYLYKEGNQLLS